MHIRLPYQLTPSAEWRAGRFLVFDAVNDGPHMADVVFHAEQGDASMRIRLGLFPGLPTRVVMPLAYLDSQVVIPGRTPHRFKCVCSGGPLDPTQLSARTASSARKMVGRLNRASASPSRTLADELPSDWPAADAPIVDELPGSGPAATGRARRGRWVRCGTASSLASFGATTDMAEGWRRMGRQETGSGSTPPASSAPSTTASAGGWSIRTAALSTASASTASRPLG